MTVDLVGIAEIAEMAGVKRNTMAQWFLRGKLPEPVASLKMGHVWLRSDVEHWLASRQADAA